MIVIIDNYDSFSFNLYQLFGGIDSDIRVVRNDALTVNELAAINPSGIILSPGPGYPAQAGICEEAVRVFSGVVPLLGVCLGHQAICEAFGATVAHAMRLVHGKSSEVEVDVTSPLFANLPNTMQAARYHSLSVQESTLPTCLRVTARTADCEDEVMAVEHIENPTFGLQFHPESILTPQGEYIARNFIGICHRWRSKQKDLIKLQPQ